MSEERDRLVEEAGRTIARGSKSFRFASQIFDLETRERSWLLYSWCRACDDITDGQTLGHDAQVPNDPDARIAFIRDATDRALAGQPTGLVPFDALARVAGETAIPDSLPHDHLAGFARDAAGWRPETEQDLLSYCYQVAGVVGVMMAHVMGVPASDRDTLDRASDLGIAFQLANIARDIVEDARVGRTYLPREWTSAEGIEGKGLADPAHRQALARIATRLADLAERYRRSSMVGAARLPFRSRWAVLSAARIYGWVATRAAELGPRAWDQRIVTTKATKFALLAAALWDSFRAPAPVSRSGLWTRPKAAATAPPRSRRARPSTGRPAGRRQNRS
ncbi:phytoene/squalene synthase family protein [Sphingomonas rhizophila]|uniref:Phytoene/squalene synthase family protein n=1 Tax=Sphingomonas rhizophila TaxID=2071607 RepID=A0A7G9SC21_9SPHN|nr:phytoene/squalene synthase family protein [Sphingomonas rhizophila]QNN65396.1 phytoene/squalene synthase family protein [Sphingomonas rhizophila]